ncbi:protein NRT1/ PTR FAMILY 5.10-like isoform X1 [Salvia hispanica]|uniref:protein NRT1/ PTR FAMILY 5.10-like isoform X1 n=1 Tax=Salvia hispanica TaxID=49212 RepID=UPI0020095DAA|nr:protein NRT1/ PTR FAMILY 5.10-like isoform X1 [Salvia hispanica]
MSQNDVVNGMADYSGRPAKRSHSGFWRSASYIMVAGAGAAERFAYFGVGTNLISYLTGELGQSTAAAAASINLWAGAGLLLPLLGALAAESFLGRYPTVVFSSLLYILALGLLTTSAFVDEQGSPSELDIGFFFVSLYLIALGQGAYKPCITAFGADQFDEQDPLELRSRSSFFNWWYFGLSAGPLVPLLALNYVQDNISWVIGFGIPCVSQVIALVVFLLGRKSYRYNIKRNEKSALNWGVVSPTIDAYSDEEDQVGLESIPHLKSLNKPLLVSGKMEEAKEMLTLIPLWAASLPFAIAISQSATLFTKQGITMDRSITPSVDLPAASLQYIIGLTIIILIPLYDRVLVPLARTLTGSPSGLTELERIGVGMLLCTLSLVVAALVEQKRLQTAIHHGLADIPGARVPMSFCWLIPQYILYGFMEVFAYIGLQELFYDRVPCSLKSVGLSIFLSIMGMGQILSSLLICLIEEITSKNGGNGWFSDNTNRAHLDYFYWLLASLNAIGFVAFLYFAKSFKNRSELVVIIVN